MHSFKPPPRRKNDKSKKSKPNVFPLKFEQLSVLTSPAKHLTQKYLPTTWHVQFASKQVQFVTTERKIKKMKKNNFSNNSTNLRNRCDSDDIKSDEVPFHLSYSSDESHTETKQRNYTDYLLSYSQNEHFQNRVPFLNVGGYEVLDSNSNPSKNQSLKNICLLTTRNEFDSINNYDLFTDLHKAIIDRNEYIRSIYGFPDLSNEQIYMCYKANLKYNLIFQNYDADDVTKCLILPSLFQVGVTIIVGSISKNFIDQLQQIKMLNTVSSKIDVLDLDSLVSERRGPVGALASISNKINMNEFDNRVIVYVSEELTMNRKIINVLQRIKDMRMLTRIIFIELDVKSIIEICACLPTVPFTALWTGTNVASSIKKIAYHSEKNFREKPILFSYQKKTVGYFVERKMTLDQVR